MKKRRMAKMDLPPKDQRPAPGYREVILNERYYLAVLPVVLPPANSTLATAVVVRVDSETEIPQSMSLATLDDLEGR